jgi:hypothetical protein
MMLWQDGDFKIAEPKVAFAYLKQLWADGARQEALERMRVFVRDPRYATAVRTEGLLATAEQCRC